MKQIDVILHSPNPVARAAKQQTGGGVHQTHKSNVRRDRRVARCQCREEER